MHEQAWDRHIRDPRRSFQSCLNKGCWTKTTGVCRNPEEQQLMLLSLGWGFQNTSDQQPCDHTVVGQIVSNMYGRVLNDKFQITRYYCCFPHITSVTLVKV